MRGSETVHIDSPPGPIWELVSDITRIGEFSPETVEGEWLEGATGPEVGARFRGHVRRNGRWPVYWTECRVITAEPGKEFGFEVVSGKQAVNTWRYRMEPSDGGTDLTESFELADLLPLRVYWAVAGHWRGKTNQRGMRTSLERIKAVVEGAS